MFLYKVKVKDTEFKYDVFSEFAVIADSEEKVVEIVQSRGSDYGEVPEYLDVSKLDIKKIADISNIESGYKNSIISCNYINA